MERTETFYRNILENMNFGYAFHKIVTDSTGKPIDYEFLEINPAFEKLTGLKEDDIIGRTVTEALPGIEDDPADWIGKYGRVALEGDILEFEQYSRPLKRWYAVTAYSPQPGYFSAVFSEISSIKQIETDSIQTKEIIQRSSNVLFKRKAEENWPVEYVSENVSQFGYSAEEFLDGKILFAEIIHPEDLQRVGGEVQYYSESKVDHFKQQYRIIDKEGKVCWVDDWTIIGRDENDNISHYLGIIVDITDRKRSEEALHKAKQETEEVNLQLKQAIERANQMAMKAKLANQAKGEFLANMSHEIRTSMNGIMGMTDLLLDTELTLEQRDFAELVKKSADSLLEILNGILDFSKIEAGKLELDILDFDLGTTLEDMNDILALRAHQKGVELVCLIEPEVPLLLQGDAGRLRQILSNLIDNAVKFTSQGEVALHVSLDAEGDDRSVILRFTIEDTGIGISDDKIDQLFVAFAQADGSTTRKFGGTGLGLAISKQLVEMMGGKIGVESEVDKGSTFYFTVRLQKQPNQERGKRIQEVDRSLLEKRILVVDDNEMNRQAISNMLTSWKCRHDTAHGAQKALEKLQTATRVGDPFHIAILDMVMLEIDGETLGKKIKTDPLFQDTALVMLTLIGERWDASWLKKAGFATYLTKPVKQAQLYDCLMTVIGRK